jgi:hypothetical protein
MLYLNRDGQRIGPYSEEEVRRQLSNGQALYSDLAWKPDSGKWLPLSQLLSPLRTSDLSRLDLVHIAGRTWEPFTRHFGLLVAVAIVGALPDLLVELAGWDVKHLFSAPGALQEGAQHLASSLVEAFGGISVYAVYQSLNGRRVSYAEAIRRGLARYWPLVLLGFLVNLLLVVGFFALVVPFFLIGSAYFVYEPACTIEGAGVFGSLSRSKELTRGFRGKLAIVLTAEVIAAVSLGYFGDGMPFVKFGINVLVAAYLSAFTTTAYVELARVKGD